MNGPLIRAVALVTLVAGAACVPEDTAPRLLDTLRDDVTDELVFEVDRVPGLSPRTEPLDGLLVEIGAVVNKPGGVRVEYDEVLDGAETRSFSDLRALEAHASDDPGVIHVLWLDGEYLADDDEVTLGVAWEHRHIAIFADTLERVCVENGGEPLTGQGIIERACGATERAVLLHEFGHVVGLVNHGLPMLQPHEDPDYPSHDTEDSIMAWGFDGPALFERVKGEVVDDDAPLAFGAASLADIAAVRDATERPEL